MTMPQDCDPEVYDRLSAARSLPEGTERVRHLEETLELALRLGGFDNEYWARSELTGALYYVPRERSALTHYAWLRRALDTAGDRLDDDDRADVLWKLKWALTHVMTMADIPLETVRQTLDDVESAFLAHGYRLRPVLEQRAYLAEDLADRPARDAAVTALRAEPRDRLSDCEACERSFQVHLLAGDDPAESLRLLEPILNGELGCGEQPAYALAQAALLHLDAGDRAGAEAAYRRGWALVKDNPKLVKQLADLSLAALRMGNVDRAADGLARRLDWYDGTDNDEHRERLAAVAALVLGTAHERGVLPEALAADAGASGQRWRRTAYQVAGAFDRRNGTDVHTRKVDELLATVAPDEPTMTPLRSATPPPVDEPDRPPSIAALAAQLRTLTQQLAGDPAELERSWAAHRESLLAELGPDPAPEVWVDVAFLERMAAWDRTFRPDRDRLEVALAAALRSGDEAARLRVEGELALAGPQERVSIGSAEFAAVEAAARRLEQLPAPAEASGLWRALAHRMDDPAVAVPCLIGSAELAQRAGLPMRQALALLDAVRLVAGQDPDRAAALLAEAEAIIAAAGGNQVAEAMAAELRARLAWSAGDPGAGAAGLREGLSRISMAGLRLPLTCLLADLLVETADWAAVEQVGRELLSAGAQRRDEWLLAYGQRHLGLALVETGRFAEAGELLEAALAAAPRLLPDLVGPIAWALGNALVGSAEPGAARTAYARAATHFEAEGRRVETAHAQKRAGDAAWDVDDLEAADAHFEAALEHAAGTHAVDVIADASRARGVLRAQRGELEAGLADLDAVPDRIAALAAERDIELDPDWVAGLRFGVLRQGAHVLAGVGEPQRSVARLDAALPGLVGEAAALVGAERALFLARAGRLDQARVAAEAMLPELPEHLAGLRQQIAAQVAQALADAGQVEAADAIWERFGPE